MSNAQPAWRHPPRRAGVLGVWLAAVVALLVAACGGGGGVGSGGTGGFASGPITGFGSVIVNEVRFDDSSASVEDGDGVAKTRDDLKLGMVVDIDSGAISGASGSQTASATRIRYDSALRGPAAGINAGAGTFSVMGQTVVIDATTVFDESLGGLATLAAGAPVEVFAVFDPASETYLAKRVARAASGAVPQVRGPVGALNTAAKTLRIGSATYAYGSAANPPSDLAPGTFVRLRLAATPSNGAYTVLSFGLALQALSDADGASLKGIVTAFVTTSSFSVNGRPVDASSAAFPDGRAGLALGVRVEVKGNLRSGTLRATEVKIKTAQQEAEGGFELNGNIEAVNSTARTFQLRGLTVSTARSDLVYQNGTAANLAVGRKVQVKGRLSDDRLRIEATQIQFDN